VAGSCSGGKGQLNTGGAESGKTVRKRKKPSFFWKVLGEDRGGRGVNSAGTSTNYEDCVKKNHQPHPKKKKKLGRSVEKKTTHGVRKKTNSKNPKCKQTTKQQKRGKGRNRGLKKKV